MQLTRALGAIACGLAACSAQGDNHLVTKRVYPATCGIITSTGWIESNGTTTPYTFQTGLPTYAGNNTLAPTQTGGSAIVTTTPGPIACPKSNTTVYIPPGSNEGINGTGNYFILCSVTYSGIDIETLSGIASAEACIDRCSADASCVAVAYDQSRGSCLKKRSVVRKSNLPAPGSIFIFSLPYFAELEHQEPPVTMPTPSPSSLPPSYDSSALPTGSFAPALPTDITSAPPLAHWTTISSTASPPGDFSLTLPSMPSEPVLPWTSVSSSASSPASSTAPPPVYLRTTIMGGSPATTVIGGSTRTYSTAGFLTTSVSGGYTTMYTTGGVTQVLTGASAPTASASSVADAMIGPCPAYNGRQYTDPTTGFTYLVSCAMTYQGTTITTFYRSRLARLAKRATVDECSARCTIDSSCVAYSSYASGQCTLYSEVTGQVPTSEAAYSAVRVEPQVVDPGTPGTTSFEPLLPQLTVTATDFSMLPASTREVTITRDASSFTYTTTLVSVFPASTLTSTELVTTTLDGSTIISTVELTTTLPASTSLSTQILTTTAPGSLIVSTYISVPPPVTVVTTMSAIVTTYVETITTQLPANLIVSTEPASTVVSTVISTLPASTLTTTFSTTLQGSTIVVTSSGPGETTTAVFTTREVSTEVRTSVVTQEASTIVSYVTLTNTPAQVTYTPPASTSLIETTIVSTLTATIVSTQITTQPTTVVSTEINTLPTTIVSTEVTTQPTTIVSTLVPSAYGLDAVLTCVSTGREYTAYDGSRFVMLCGLVVVGTELQTVVTTSFSACVEICNQYGTSCAASGWDTKGNLCRLYSFMYLDFADAVPSMESFTDSALRLSGPQGLAARSQIVVDGDFASGTLSAWSPTAPGRGSAQVVNGQAQLNVDNYRTGGPIVLSQALSATAGYAFLLELRLGASGTFNPALTGIQGVTIEVTTADGFFLGYHEMLLGEDSTMHYASGSFPTDVTGLRLEATCYNCGPEVDILLDDIALYVYPPGVGGFGVTATLTPAASTITQDITVVSTQLTTVPTTIVSTFISLEYTTVPSTVVSTTLQSVTVVSTVTPTPSNYGFNGYNTVPSCLSALNAQTYVAADESRFVMLCQHYIEGETLSSTPASSYSNCIERCNAALGCAGMEWMPDTLTCQLYTTLTDAYAPSDNPIVENSWLQPPYLRDAAIRLTGPGGPNLRQSLLSNGGFDDGLNDWSYGPADGASVTVVDGAATLAYSSDVNTISLTQTVHGNVGDGFVLALRLSAGGNYVNQFISLPFVEITAYLDNQLAASFVTIQGDKATVVYAGGRLQTSATLLTIVARITTGSGLTGILDDISLHTWKTANSQNALCTDDGSTYTSTTDSSQFVMLCNTGLGSGNIYRTLSAAGYSQCVELCAQQGTICAGAVWEIDTQDCSLYDRSGLQESGSPDSDYRNSAIRLTGPPNSDGSYSRTPELINGAFDGGTYSPDWTVESGGNGNLDVSANTQALVISTRVGSGSRTINQAISGTVGDVYLLTLTVSIPMDISYTSIRLLASLDTYSVGYLDYDNSKITGSQRMAKLYASGTLMQSPELLRLSVEFDTAAWISLDDIQFYTFSRSDARAQTTIIYGTAYDFDGYAMATYAVPQVTAGQSFRIEMQGFFLTIPDDKTSCRVTMYSNKGGGNGQTILFTGVWDIYTIPISPQRFVNSGLILGTTTAFDIDFICTGTTGSTLDIASINFYVNTALLAQSPSPVIARQPFAVDAVLSGAKYTLEIAVTSVIPYGGYCTLYLEFDSADPSSKTQKTTVTSPLQAFSISGTATTDLSTLYAESACYGSNGYVSPSLAVTVTQPRPQCSRQGCRYAAVTINGEVALNPQQCVDSCRATLGCVSIQVSAAGTLCALMTAAVEQALASNFCNYYLSDLACFPL